MSREISEIVKRKLYAESMGRCMNPACQKELLSHNGDIIEKAHIYPYCETADNSFENLVVLCPNCHTDFDKNSAFTQDEVQSWKKIRQEELNRIFGNKYDNFDDLKHAALPFLLENKTIYDKYYLTGNNKLWDKFTPTILSNNRKLKTLFQNNFDLFQKHSAREYSNLDAVKNFLLHVDEFESTRLDLEKTREVLFPKIINSIFGIDPLHEWMLPMTESLEELITKLKSQNKFAKITLGIEEPYITIIDNGRREKIFLNDTPRLRQLYFDFKCYKATKVRLESLNHALKIIRKRHIDFTFLNFNNLREISINGTKLIFIYEYCLSKVELLNLSPEENSVIVNLHNWNGSACISAEAHSFARTINVELLTMDGFYVYINKI